MALGIPCTYDYQPKKRGVCVLHIIVFQSSHFSCLSPRICRPFHSLSGCFAYFNLISYLRRLQEAAAAAANGQQDDIDASPSPLSAHTSIASPIQTRLSPILTRQDRQDQHSPFLEPSLQPLSAVAAIPMPPSRYPIAADGFNRPRMSSVSSLPSPSYEDPRVLGTVTNGSSLGSPHPMSSDSQHYPSPTESFSTYPLYNWSYKQHQALHVPSPKAWPPLSLYYRPHRLEEIAPRETFSLIIGLFFDFV